MHIYRKFMICTLMLLLAFPAYAVDYVPGDVLVVLKPSDPESRLSASSLEGMGAEALRTASFAAASGAWVKQTYPELSEAGGSVYALIHSEIKTPEELTSELLRNPEVLAASPNYTVHAAIVPDDTHAGDCWGMSYINAYSAWDITTGSNTVYVAVLDSGIDDTNPDLAENVATEYGANTISPSSSARDDYGHGTHVAGTIGAVGNNGLGVAGINWNVGLISVKTLDSTGSGSFSDVINAINYVTGLIRQGVNIRAVNLSLETYIPYAPTHDNLVTFPLWRAFKELDSLNETVIVCAAGNYNAVVGQPTTTTKFENGSIIYRPGYYVYPASFNGLDNMISVSALDSNGSAAYFTNTGADIYAPGVDILSTWLQSDSKYVVDGVSLRLADGTSMAAPHVAGAAALLASVRQDATAYQLKRIILDSTSTGILDLIAALNYQANTPNIPEKSTDWTEYSDYSEYNPTEQADYDNQNNEQNWGRGLGDLNQNNEQNWGQGLEDLINNVSSGSCSGESLNIFALILVCPLVKKFMSW